VGSENDRLVRLLMWVAGQSTLLRMQDEQGRTALHNALRLGQHEAANLLLDYGADIRLRSHTGALPLHEAVSTKTSCTEPLLRRLSGEGWSLLGSRDSSDRGVLQLAIEAGDPATIGLLLDLGAEPYIKNAELIHAAVKTMDCSGVLVRGVLAALAGQGLVFLDSADDRGYSCLLQAIESGRPKTALALIKLGANVSLCSHKKYSPLHVVARTVWTGTDFPAIEALLQQLVSSGGHLLDGEDSAGLTPLHYSVSHDNSAIADKLLDLKACPAKRSRVNSLALHLAAWYSFSGSYSNNESVLRRLMGRDRVLIDAQDSEGSTPLHIALKGGFSSTVNMLLDMKCSVEVKEKSGSLPLHVVAGNGHDSTFPREIITRLCGDNLSLLDQCDSLGNTALHKAAFSGNVSVVTHLINLRCDTSIRNSDNQTAVGLALHCGNEATLSLLQRRGVEPSISERTHLASLVLYNLPTGLRWWETDALSVLYKGKDLSLAVKQRLLRDFGEDRRSVGEHSAHRLELTCWRDAPMTDLCDQLNADILAYGDLEVVFCSSSGGRETAVGQGLRQEWYSVVKAELADPNRALLASRDGGKTLDINPHSGLNPNHLDHFRVLGKIIALALAHGENIDGLRISSPLRKVLLAREIAPAQIGEFDPEWGRVLEEVASKDVSSWGLRFEADLASMPFDPTGNLRPRSDRIPVELEPGGHDKEVDEYNKGRFIELMSQKLIRDYLSGMAAQVKATQEGIESILGSAHVLRRMRQLLDHTDLDLLIGGRPTIDRELFEQAVEYQNCSAETPQVKWFWAVVRNLDQEGLERLLHFVTGSSSVPAGGFNMFSSYEDTHPRITIALEDTVRKTCRAATCFNTLYLPSYPSREVLEDGLQLSLGCAAGFDEFEHP